MTDITTTSITGQLVSTAIAIPTASVTAEDGGAGLADIDTDTKARTYDLVGHSGGISTTPYGTDKSIRHRNELLQILSRGIGAELPVASVDGDLALIDTATERQTRSPVAHTDGNASDRWSLASLFRWAIAIFQDVTEASHVRVNVYSTTVILAPTSTPGTGLTTWQALPSQACNLITIKNISDGRINVRYVSTTATVMLFPGEPIDLSCSNANQIEIQNDVSPSTGSRIVNLVATIY